MIGGNIVANMQIKVVGEKNAIGQRDNTWQTVENMVGFLDYISGDAMLVTFSAKVQESTHLFICDYKQTVANLSAEESRAVINNKIYNILLIDNPMELNKHLELYLKYVGGQ